MNRFQFKAARQKLGLSQRQLATLLHYENILSISAMERAVNWRHVPYRLSLLMEAMLLGYRPPGWDEVIASKKGRHKLK